MQEKNRDHAEYVRTEVEKIAESAFEKIDAIVSMVYENLKNECSTWGELQERIRKEIDYSWDSVVPMKTELKNHAAHLMRQRLKMDMEGMRIDKSLHDAI